MPLYKNKAFPIISKIIDRMREDGFDVLMEIKHINTRENYKTIIETHFKFSYTYYINGKEIKQEGAIDADISVAFAHCVVAYKRYKNYVEDFLIVKYKPKSDPYDT